MRVLSVLGFALVMLAAAFIPKSSFAISEEELKYEALKEQIQYLRDRNEALEKKVESLDGKKMEGGEAKKEEKKDAWYDKVSIEYKKPGDGFRIKAKDGSFSLRTRLRTQFQFSIRDEEGDEDTVTDFNVRRLRISWDGNAFKPWMFYSIQLAGDNSGAISVRDAFFDIAYNTLFAPRIGQYKVPFSREELNSSGELQLVERSVVNEEFAFGRDRGASVYGVIGNYVVYGVGVFNGDGINGRSRNSDLLYAGRVTFVPCCGELKYKSGSFPIGGDYSMEPNFGDDKLQIAISGGFALIPSLVIADKTPDGSVDDRFDEIGTEEADVSSFTADINVKYSRLSLEADYFYRSIEPDEAGLEEATDHGFRVQGGIFIIPDFIEIAARYGYIAFDDDVEGRESRQEISPGINFYLSKDHKWKVQLGYSLITDEDTAGEELDAHVFRTQFQAAF